MDEPSALRAAGGAGRGLWPGDPRARSTDARLVSPALILHPSQAVSGARRVDGERHTLCCASSRRRRRRSRGNVLAVIRLRQKQEQEPPLGSVHCCKTVLQYSRVLSASRPVRRRSRTSTAKKDDSVRYYKQGRDWVKQNGGPGPLSCWQHCRQVCVVSFCCEGFAGCASPVFASVLQGPNRPASLPHGASYDVVAVWGCRPVGPWARSRPAEGGAWCRTAGRGRGWAAEQVSPGLPLTTRFVTAV